jgi:hypothetical protein
MKDSKARWRVWHLALVKGASFSEDGMVQHWSAPLGCAAVIFCAAGAARAQSPVTDGAFNVALEYKPISGCPDVGDFKALVARRLGRDPFQELARDHVVVLIASSNAELGGRLEWRDRAGHWAGDQAFPPRPGGCHELALEMGVALAVQIQLLALSSAWDTPPESPPAPPAEHLALPVRPPESTAGAEPPIRAHTEADVADRSAAFSVGAGASVGLGMSANAIALAGVFGRVAWSTSSIELTFEASLPSTTRREDGAGFSQRVLLVGAAECKAYERLSACLVAKGGEVRAHGRQVDLPASSSGVLVQTGLRVAANQRLGAVAYLDVRGEGLVNLTSWNVNLDREPVWTAPRLAETLGFDFGVFFP